MKYEITKTRPKEDLDLIDCSNNDPVPRLPDTGRRKRGFSLFADDSVILAPKGHFVIGSKGTPYKVTEKGCTCPDYQQKDAYCKHQIAVDFFEQIFQEVNQDA